MAHEDTNIPLFYFRYGCGSAMALGNHIGERLENNIIEIPIITSTSEHRSVSVDPRADECVNG